MNRTIVNEEDIVRYSSILFSIILFNTVCYSNSSKNPYINTYFMINPT